MVQTLRGFRVQQKVEVWVRMHIMCIWYLDHEGDFAKLGCIDTTVVYQRADILADHG